MPTSMKTSMQSIQLATTHIIAAPEGKVTRVLRPADDMLDGSKRVLLIENMEGSLQREMEVLQENTSALNKEVEKQMMELQERILSWETKLKNDIQDRDQTFTRMTQESIERFEKTFAHLEQKTLSAFERFEKDQFPPCFQRQENYEINFQKFTEIEVPSIIEDLQGNVTRCLQKSQETFDIDNTKLLKREKKIVDRIAAHEKNTTESFADEQKTANSKRDSTLDMYHEIVRTGDRHVERMHCSSLEKIAATQSQIHQLQSVRERNDVDILENLAQTVTKLQHTILTNFGVSETTDGNLTRILGDGSENGKNEDGENGSCGSDDGNVVNEI